MKTNDLLLLQDVPYELPLKDEWVCAWDFTRLERFPGSQPASQLIITQATWSFTPKERGARQGPVVKLGAEQVRSTLLECRE